MTRASLVRRPFNDDVVEEVELAMTKDDAAKLVALLSHTGSLLGPLLALAGLPGMEDLKRQYAVKTPHGAPIPYFKVEKY